MAKRKSKKTETIDVEKPQNGQDASIPVAEEKEENTQEAEVKEKSTEAPQDNIDSVDSREEDDNSSLFSAEPKTLDGAKELISLIKNSLLKAEAEKADLKDQLMRLNAEFINFRKRKEKEVSDSIRFANVDLLKKLLPILDNFDRTLDSIEKTDNLAAIKEGITLVDKSMRQQFGKVGLEPIESIGTEFDTDLHEAVVSIPTEEEDKKGKVVDVVEKGYKLKDRVIRFSKVIVGE